MGEPYHLTTRMPLLQGGQEAYSLRWTLLTDSWTQRRADRRRSARKMCCKSCCRKPAPTVRSRRRRERKLELRNPQRAASIEPRSTRRADSLDDRPTGFGDTRLRVCHRELSQNCRGRSDFSASLFLPEVFFCKVVRSQIGVFNRATMNDDFTLMK